MTSQTSLIAIDELSLSDRRLLIIDDEAEVRQLYATWLGKKYDCHTAATPQKAFDLLDNDDYALVITDVVMPEMNGIELLREIRSRYPQTAVVMISGYDCSQRVIDSMRLGASDYLLKPCDLDVLELSVERALQTRALLRAAHQSQRDLERRNAELAARQAELERLQMQLVHSEKMASLGALAAGVAHELNNPAGFIYGNMEILREMIGNTKELLKLYDESFAQNPPAAPCRARIAQLKDKIDYDEMIEDLASMIDDCHGGAERIRDVVQNLRTFSRLDEAEYKQVDIHEGLESTLRLIHQDLATRKIQIERSFSNLPLVDCYAGQLNQVWLNLIVNAAHAISRKDASLRESQHAENSAASENLFITEDCPRRIRIATQLENNQVCICINDTGGGIAPEHISKIFDPFFTTKPIGEGNGLGLSITYGIVERHNGSITVESKEDVGTSFFIRLPVKANQHRNSESTGQRLNLRVTTNADAAPQIAAH